MDLNDLKAWQGWIDAQFEAYSQKKWFLILMMVVYPLPLLVVCVFREAFVWSVNLFFSFKALWKRAKWRW